MSEPFDVNRYWLERGRRYMGETRLALEYHRRQEQFILQTLARLELPVSNILELGCGFGRITRLLAAAFPNASITALDLSPDQLAHAQTYCQGLDQVRFRSYDFYSGDPFPAGPCQLAVAIEVFLHHPPELIRQLLRRLQQTSPCLAHLDWYEPWSGPLPPHVWIHDYPAYHRELGWECAALPLPERTEGKQQVLFVAAANLPPTLPPSFPGGTDFAVSPGSPTDPASEEFESQSWEHRLVRARQDLLEIIPEGHTFILADGDAWGLSEFPGGRHRLPFLERNGQYWGPPADDATAWAEILRMRETGADWLVVGWNQFWLFQYFARWHEQLRECFPCVLENPRLVVFRLNPSATPYAQQPA